MTKRREPTLQHTKNYDRFEPHPHNRDVTNTKVLESSMEEHGFDPGLPIRCESNGNGKLKITHGHHRFHVARKLGLPIWFIVASKDIPLFESEASAHTWDVEDFTQARTRAGEKAPAAALDFHQRTGIPLNSVISMLGGEGASSGNKVKEMKSGKFKIGDTKHADQVAGIVRHCTELGVSFAATSYFVKALSKCLFVPEFDAELFMHKVAIHVELMTPRRAMDDYLDLIEMIYNRQSKKKIPLAFRTREVGAARKASFGRSSK